MYTGRDFIKKCHINTNLNTSNNKIITTVLLRILHKKQVLSYNLVHDPILKVSRCKIAIKSCNFQYQEKFLKVWGIYENKIQGGAQKGVSWDISKFKMWILTIVFPLVEMKRRFVYIYILSFCCSFLITKQRKKN